MYKNGTEVDQRKDKATTTMDEQQVLKKGYSEAQVKLGRTTKAVKLGGGHVSCSEEVCTSVITEIEDQDFFTPE